MAELKTALGREISSIKAPQPKEVSPRPIVGQPAPNTPTLQLPRSKPTLIVFLRQCGDPFAEKTFRSLAALSTSQPGLACIAVSQASRSVTDGWVSEIGGAWETEVIADFERDLFARWGLGLNTAWQLYNPRALYSTWKLGRDEGIWGRYGGSGGSASVETTTEAATDKNTTGDGTVWQMGGAFAVDTTGLVQWVHVKAAADDLVDFDPVLRLFGLPVKPKKKPEA